MNYIEGDRLFNKMDLLGRKGIPFFFLIDAFAEKGVAMPLSDTGNDLFFDINGLHTTIPPDIKDKPDYWNIRPVPYEQYKVGFNLIMDHIRRGDSFLLNYTQPTAVETSLSLEELYRISRARYKVHLKGVFTCFSPETFVSIGDDGIISSHPMKGTAVDSGENAEEILLSDSKEIAEHHTIVDLIRNDLSRVADHVEVEKFRYTERIATNRQNLIQVSSKITGRLPSSWRNSIGSIFREMLPAGSVTGAPKNKTVEIIKNVENYSRGWYTGIFGIFDGLGVHSAVLIRYIEQADNHLVFKSGGGITFQSDCRSEYDELIKKVYVPLA